MASSGVDVLAEVLALDILLTALSLARVEGIAQAVTQQTE